MATGVQPRDEDHQFTRNDIEALEDAMKNKKFRELLGDYFDEIRDPVNQDLYQKEMTQLEKERGYDIKFINPKGSYVIKTSVAGDRKAFINICSNENVNKPSYTLKVIDGCRGMNWSIPYSLIPPREDYDQKRQKCVIYDVVFHPDTIRMAEVNKQFRDLVNSTAFDALKTTYNIELDCNNVCFPKSYYKGMTTSAVIRKEDPNFKPPSEEENSDLNSEILEKLYPQKNYPDQKQEKSNKFMKSAEKNQCTVKVSKGDSSIDYTIPKYVIKQQKSVDIQEYTFEKNTKEFSAIPSHLYVQINLPLLSSTADCSLDIKNKKLTLLSEKPAKYKLDLDLPYLVDDKGGTAKFDVIKRVLSVTLPVIKKNNNSFMNSVKTDSGVDSEDYPVSQSDEDISKEVLISELSSADSGPISINLDVEEKYEFLDTKIGYVLPPHTHNILDDMVAFTFHVKNTDPESVVVKKADNKVQIKFTSIGSGFVPIHYASTILFDDNITFENVSGEAWDNNVILQLELSGPVPQKYQIGLSEDTLTSEFLDVPPLNNIKEKGTDVLDKEMNMSPIVEVTNTGTETNILVSSRRYDIDDDDDDVEEDDAPSKERAIVWVEDEANGINAKSILRKHIGRSISESSVGEVASSMDYISSDCIPEESSLKKSVRFSNSIAKQTYRYNSSIEGQKKKNQRKKSKKRNLQRRKSQSDAEEEGNTPIMTNKSIEKCMMKKRRDSGLADTSDADTDGKVTPSTTPNQTNNNIKTNLDNNEGNNNVGTNSAYVFRESGKSKSDIQGQGPPGTCDNNKRKTRLHNPDNLKKGQYVEVKFKNDLIFDLDM